MSVCIIAEIGVNHNGSVVVAKQLIDAAYEAGADVVKFQTFKAEKIISTQAPKADYQKQTTGTDDSQLEMVRKLELDENAHRELFSYVDAKGIEFMSSPFDVSDIDFLCELGVKRLKIPSGEIVNAPYLFRAARTGLPLIMSTGMCGLEDIRTALAMLAYGYLYDSPPADKSDVDACLVNPLGLAALQKNVSLLHCTTEYPAPFETVNLRAMDTIANEFGLPVGYSDHTKGNHVAVAAVARGAVIIEKHFTLSHNMEGPDHRASLEPEELTNLVEQVRQIESALGDGTKAAFPCEEKNKIVARKSLVALHPIKEGEVFSLENLGVKRPGNGRSPFDYWALLGTTATKNYRNDEVIR